MEGLFIGTGYSHTQNIEDDTNEHDDQKDHKRPENTADLLFPEEVNADLFFGGEPFLLTKESSEDCYRITRLSDSQYRKINNMMHHGQKRTEESPAPTEQIWICDGKGLVKSPHLENSPGNEYYGQLFDYDAELILSKEMTKYLEDLTS